MKLICAFLSFALLIKNVQDCFLEYHNFEIETINEDKTQSNTLIFTYKPVLFKLIYSQNSVLVMKSNVK
jgi:hypothetical protein